MRWRLAQIQNVTLGVVVLTVGVVAPSMVGRAGPVADDVTAPTTPAIVNVDHSAVDEVTLRWETSTDDVGIAGYRVLRNGTPIAASDAVGGSVVGELTATVDNIAQGVSWFQVQAVDAAGNESRRSFPARIRVDNTAPSAPTAVSIDSYDSTSGCADISFGYPHGDGRSPSWELIDWRGPVGHLDSTNTVQTAADRWSGTVCVPVDGTSYHFQVITRLASDTFGESVRSTPVKFQATSRKPLDGFSVDESSDGSWNARWDTPSTASGALRVVVLDRLEPIAETTAGETSVEFDLDPGRSHWIQAVTIDQWGNETRRTAPQFIAAQKNSGSIGDRVFADLNGDGLHSSGEPGVANATVTLTDTTTGGIVDTVTTGPDGDYGFGGLDTERCYTVTVTAQGQTPTLASIGDNPAVDSDIDAEGVSNEICLSEQATRSDIDAGLAPTAFDTAPTITINLEMYWDENNNQTRDPGEAPLRAGRLGSNVLSPDLDIPVSEREFISETIGMDDNGMASATFEFLYFDEGIRCNRVSFGWEPVGGTPPDEIIRPSTVSAPFAGGGKNTTRGEICVGQSDQRNAAGPIVGTQDYEIDVIVGWAGPDPEA